MSKWVCPKCGAPYRKWETRCPKCGFRVKVTEEDKRRAERTLRQMRISRYASLVSGPVFIGIGLLTMFMSGAMADSPYARYLQNWWIIVLLGISVFITGLLQQIQLSRMKDQLPSEQEDKRYKRPR
jgi:DNA-directed RNA polymerase subunit RPC12/RpoP/general stress protein CsbA